MNESFFSRTDEELALLSGTSQAAMEELISRYTRLVRACARPMFLAGADQDDLIQEGMIGLLGAVRSYSAESGVPFSAYAAVCVRRRLISAVRAASAQKHAPLNDSVSFHSFSFDDLALGSLKDDPEAAVISREGFNEFIAALHDRLSASERKVLSLYLDGVSYREIAARIGKPEKSVDNAVQRIRRKAEQLFGENGPSV